MVFPFHFPQAQGGNSHSQRFCSGRGDPDSVYAPNQREQQDGHNLEYQRTQEGNPCRNQAVVQRREKRRGEDSEP